MIKPALMMSVGLALLVAASRFDAGLRTPAWALLLIPPACFALCALLSGVASYLVWRRVRTPARAAVRAWWSLFWSWE